MQVHCPHGPVNSPPARPRTMLHTAQLTAHSVACVMQWRLGIHTTQQRARIDTVRSVRTLPFIKINSEKIYYLEA